VHSGSPQHLRRNGKNWKQAMFSLIAPCSFACCGAAHTAFCSSQLKKATSKAAGSFAGLGSSLDLSSLSC